MRKAPDKECQYCKGTGIVGPYRLECICTSEVKEPEGASLKDIV